MQISCQDKPKSDHYIFVRFEINTGIINNGCEKISICSQLSS